jgi:diguanylate cyclase (GGDEF)-like protein
MNLDPSDPSSRMSRELLLASFAVLVVPVAATLFLPERTPESAFLWFLALVPILLWSYAFQWRGAALALASSLGVLLLAQVAGATRGLPPDPVLPGVVLTLLGTGVGLAMVMDRTRQDRRSMDEVALTDRLTGLPNRRHARVFLETMFGAAERGRNVSVVIFDLDDFRRYNDRMGPKEGDAALQAFAALLAASTRRMNLSARLGGEEFMSILSGADEEGARAFADRVRETFRLSRPASRELTVSAGVASFHPSMRRPDELVGAADLALFRAKEEGGDRVRVFGKDIRAGDTARSPAEAPTPAPPLPADGLPLEDGERPGVSVTDFARPAEEIGTSPPPAHLLPPRDPRFGLGRWVTLIETEASGPEGIRPYLEREGFVVDVAHDATSGLMTLAREADLILLDPEVPGPGTREFIRAAKSRWPSTQLVILSREAQGATRAGGLLPGADDVLTRPVQIRALQSILVDALERRDRTVEEVAQRQSLPSFSGRSADRGERLLLRGLFALVRAEELRDPLTQGHAIRVSRYATAILDQLGDPQGIDREGLVAACLVHDIGKLEIPESILLKNAPLTADEFGKVRRHPASGREILAPITSDPLTLAVTGWHHERWDGSGYPDGLAGEAIPLSARIVAMADALDAMTSPRAYRAGLGWEDAVRQIRERFGSHYDPALSDPFWRALPALRRIYGEARPASRVEGAAREATAATSGSKRSNA